MKYLSPDFLRMLHDTCDIDWLVRESNTLNDIEYYQSFKEYEESAKYVYNLLKEKGFNPDFLTFPADGKTVYQDKRTPLAWRITKGTLEITKSEIPFENPIIADYKTSPFSVVKHSVSTPEGGIDTTIVTEDDMLAGADCKGKLVFLNSDTRPRYSFIPQVLDRGAIGFISDNIKAKEETPDYIQWLNAGTDDGNHWNVQCEDRDFIGFMLTPRTGKQLKEACSKGEVSVHIECDGERYEGEIHAVTAVLPGESTKELWIVAHLYEPFIADNSGSVMTAIASLMQIRQLQNAGKLPKLKYTIRVVFAMEFYGYAAMAEHFGGCLRDKVIGGINIDTPPMEKTDTHYALYMMPYASPYFGNCVLHALGKLFLETFPNTEGVIRDAVYYCDDAALGDPTVGVPIVWAMHQADDYHHNSIQNDDFLDIPMTQRFAAFSTLLTILLADCSAELVLELLPESLAAAEAKLLEEVDYANNCTARMSHFLNGEKGHILDFKRIADLPEIEETAAKLKLPKFEEHPIAYEAAKRAEGIICERVGNGFPFDLINFPKNNRRPIPDGMLYGPMGLIIAGMDGKKNLAELIHGAWWECHREINDEKINEYIDFVLYLAEGGYLKIK